jgi:hypothetical protein
MGAPQLTALASRGGLCRLLATLRAWDEPCSPLTTLWEAAVRPCGRAQWGRLRGDPNPDPDPNPNPNPNPNHCTRRWPTPSS